MRSNHWLRLIFLAATAAVVAACSGGGSESTPQKTTLSISLMDAAVDDVTEVNVQIAAMWLKPSDGPAFQLALTQTPMTVDLLAHGGDDAAILVDEAAIEPGSYEWLRMDVNAEFDNVYDSFVKTDTGGMEEVRVPSGIVRLVSGFDIPANQGVELLFDWDLRRGLVRPPGQPGYFLKPAFRMIDVNVFGGVHGTIAAETVTATANDCNADSPAPASDFAVGNTVYIYAGLNVEPDDIDGVDPEPVTTVDAVDGDNDGDYEYKTMLAPGDYTIAFTCQAGNDVADTNDTGNSDPTLNKVKFVSSVSKTIGGDDVEVNF